MQQITKREKVKLMTFFPLKKRCMRCTLMCFWKHFFVLDVTQLTATNHRGTFTLRGAQQTGDSSAFSGTQLA